MSISQHYDDLSLAPLKQDLQGYSRDTLWKDLFSGLSVTLVALPQSMAFALVAGLPLSCGLVASIYGTLIAALFGSSRHLVVGPNNAIAILVQYATAGIMYTFFRGVEGVDRELIALQIVTQLSLFVGLFQIVAAVGKLGRLVQFVSHSVVVGYLVGTAAAVTITQMYHFLGLEPAPGFQSIFNRAVNVISQLHKIHWPTAMVGIGSLSLLALLIRLDKRIPAAVVTLIVSSMFVYFSGLTTGSEYSIFGLDKERIGVISLVGDAGDLQEGLAYFSLPAFNAEVLSFLLPIAFAITLISILETSLVAKNVAAQTGQRLAVNQEILGLGLGNLISAFFAALPCSGSPTRSGMLVTNGGKTRFAAVFSALGVALVVYFFGSIVSRLPLASLSAILIYTAGRIVNRSQLLVCCKATYADAFVLVATLFSCLFFTLDVAFYIGIAMSIIFYLKKAAVPHFDEVTYDEVGRLGHINAAWRREKKEIRVINIQGELFFGAADLFQATLRSIAEDDSSTHVIILRLKNARDMDATACLALQQLYEHLRASGRHLLACGLSYQNWQVLCDSGVVEKIEKDNLFIFDERYPRHTLQYALIRAKELIAVDEAASKQVQAAQIIVSQELSAQKA